MASSIRGRMVTPSSSTWRGSSDAGPHTPTSAPSLVRPQMLLRATRLCRMSPQIAILSPSIRTNRSRSVSMASRPWVGCSCLPSPALITLERMRCPRNCAAPEAPCRIHHVDPHRFQILGGVHQGLAFADRRTRGSHVHRIGGEPLLGKLERDPGSGRGLEEQIHDGLSPEGGHLLDRPLAHLLERLRRIQDQLDLLGTERLQPYQILAQTRRAHGITTVVAPSDGVT